MSHDLWFVPSRLIVGEADEVSLAHSTRQYLVEQDGLALLVGCESIRVVVDQSKTSMASGPGPPRLIPMMSIGHAESTTIASTSARKQTRSPAELGDSP